MRQLRFVALAFAIIVTVGTVGYRVLTGAPMIDALFMTAITVSTVGYGEVVPLTTPASKVFTMGLLLVSLLVFAWAVRSAAELLFAEYLWHFVGRQRMQRQIDRLRDHVVVAGFGRMGRATVAELEAEGEMVVVVESNQDRLARDPRPSLFVEGDATHDDTLERAGLAGAKAVIALTDSDATNVMIVLSARAVRPDIQVAARADHEDAVRKLQRAGADYVLQHYGTGAMHMALAVTHPAVEDVLNQLIPRRGQMDLGQLTVTPDAALVGRTLSELAPLRHGALVMAILRDGQAMMPPEPDVPLAAGDVLVVAGSRGALTKMRASMGGTAVLVE